MKERMKLNSNLFLALAATTNEQQENNSPNFNNNKFLANRKFKYDPVKLQKDDNEIEFFS